METWWEGVATRWRRIVRHVAFVTTIRVLAVVAAAAAIVFAVWLLPDWLNPSTKLDPESELTSSEWLTAKNATRTSLVALLVAMVGMGTLLYTVRSYRLARIGQVTDRYTKAVDQLGVEDAQVRVGGVYALEKIVRDSPQDQRAVIDVLLAHVRASQGLAVAAPSDPSNIALDVVAGLQVLGRQTRPDDMSALDLRRLDLRGVDLTGANLSRCRLDGTHLDEAVLIGANLRGAVLTGASLTNAQLASADLIRAELTGVALAGADFFNTKVIAAQLMEEQKREVVNWDAARLYTAVGGSIRPAVTR